MIHYMLMYPYFGDVYLVRGLRTGSEPEHLVWLGVIVNYIHDRRDSFLILPLMPLARRYRENPLLFPPVSLPAAAGYGELAADPFLLQMVYADQLGERIAMLEGIVLEAVSGAIGQVTGALSTGAEPVPERAVRR